MKTHTGDRHPSLTKDRIEDAVRERLAGAGHSGFCLAWGADADGVEPEADGYQCED